MRFSSCPSSSSPRSSSVFCFFRLLTLVSLSLPPSLVRISSGSRFLFFRLSLDDCVFLDAFFRRRSSSFSELVVVSPPAACFLPARLPFLKTPPGLVTEESCDASSLRSLSAHIEEPKAGSYCPDISTGCRYINGVASAPVRHPHQALKRLIAFPRVPQ